MKSDMNFLLLLIYYSMELNIKLIICSSVFLLVQLLSSQKNFITISYILPKSYNAQYVL